MAAAAKNDLAGVKAALAGGQSINTLQSWSHTVGGSRDGPDINTYRGVSALVAAISMRNKGVVEFLLQQPGIDCSSAYFSCSLGGDKEFASLFDTSIYHYLPVAGT